ncbi:LIM/homeobox protein Lhx1 [Entomophthora muscae]|uniref:LIM/homeobox protein Lhx1 n=1 Tax=Entomophthora muscae TaxID=34485 RepID=A0ACC2TWK3_9FUNG|nr:LIM/homeobox protein Lhx1 [Entomophthora muscae]
MSFQFFDTNPIRHRSKLTQREFNILESLFQQDSNPRLVIRRNLARQMGMRQRTIQIWFQNRRAKAIRLNEPISHSTPISPTLQAMAPTTCILPIGHPTTPALRYPSSGPPPCPASNTTDINKINLSP